MDQALTELADLLRELGPARNPDGSVCTMCTRRTQRYPRFSLAELRATGPDLVVLPDEPYRFTRDDGPEAFAPLPCALVSGRHLTWYGPSLAEARDLLAGQLADPVVGSG